MVTPIQALGSKLKPSRRTSVLLLVCAIGALAFWALPPNAMNPLCTVKAQYRVDAELQTGDETIKSNVIMQHAISSIGAINSGGCKSYYGDAIAFRSKSDLVYLIPSLICNKALTLLEYDVNVIQTCSAEWPNKSIGFIINDANSPKTWETFNFLSGSSGVKLVKMHAKSTWRHPYDNLDIIAPNIVKTYYEGKNWWYSPERILYFFRRNGNFLYRAQQVGPDHSRN